MTDCVSLDQWLRVSERWLISVLPRGQIVRAIDNVGACAVHSG